MQKFDAPLQQETTPSLEALKADSLGDRSVCPSSSSIAMKVRPSASSISYRAYALAGDKTRAHTAYQDFLALWKDADPDIPVLKEARSMRSHLELHHRRTGSLGTGPDADLKCAALRAGLDTQLQKAVELVESL